MTSVSLIERPYPLPVDEELRLRAVASYDIVDGPPEPDLDLLAQLAADLCGVSRAVVNIIAAEHQHQVGAFGGAPAVCTRGDSMCAVTITETAPIFLTDASLDRRFVNNPHVNGQIDAIRFYASAQLRVGEGQVIGTLCVFDTAPRELTVAQQAGLERLARMVVDVLELRRHTRLVQAALAEKQAALAEKEAVLRALEEAHREVVRSNNELQQFAGQVSHDLKNPLTGVLGFIASLNEVPAVIADPAARWMLDRALSSGTRMFQMIEDVLGHAAVNGRTEVEPVDLNDVAAQVLDDLSEAITEAAAGVTVDELPTVTGNPTQLRVLLQNLVGNAVKYRHPDRPCRVRIVGESWPALLTVSVVDNGRGIPPEFRDRVTELFARVHTDVEGTGIGLATCQRIAATHHGTLSIGDSENGGTTVTLTLPRVWPGG